MRRGIVWSRRSPLALSGIQISVSRLPRTLHTFLGKIQRAWKAMAREGKEHICRGCKTMYKKGMEVIFHMSDELQSVNFRSLTLKFKA